MRSEFSSAGASQTGTEVLALPHAPDANYYGARDLDRYPRPLAPLQIDRTAGDGAREVRLEILVDERGIVQDMTFAGPAAPARVEEALRAALTATRFLPAQKDGRAVKSRIVLSVNFDPNDDER
jgi:protein TonB